MAEVIKKASPGSDQFSRHVLGKEMNGEKPEKFRKIIKGREASFSAVRREIPSTRHSVGGPRVSPLRGSKGIEGVEFVCRCGERVVIHFDYENDGKPA